VSSAFFDQRGTLTSASNWQCRTGRERDGFGLKPVRVVVRARKERQRDAISASTLFFHEPRLT
jgi:hypothetical protein